MMLFLATQLNQTSTEFTRRMNQTQAQRARSTAVDLAKKLLLEKKLDKEMRAFFSRISKAASSEYRATGNIINASDFQLELKELLAKHYRRVFREFSGSADDIAKSLFARELKQDASQEVINSNRDEYIEQHSSEQSQIITETNQREIDAAFAAASVAALASVQQRIEAGEAGATVDNSEVARQAQASVKSRGDGRSSGIALTETQAPAEKSKEIEAAALATALFLAGEPVNIKKVWVTVGDSRVRASHVQADGQVQNSGDPFIVQGQRLMQPGDTSLGATADNIINCRCSAQYLA
jgi:hypothetical protein